MALDPFLSSILRAFQKSHGYEQLAEPEAFERLVNYCCVAGQHTHEFDTEDLCMGGGQDLGIDGIAIIANGHVVTTLDQWQEIATQNKKVDVTFVVCQAKLRSSFEGAAIGTFLEGANSFFQHDATAPENLQIAEARTIKNRIYQDVHVLADRPSLFLSYACAGTWNNDVNLAARVNAGVGRLEQTQLFGKVTFAPLDSERLRRMYGELTQEVQATIELGADPFGRG